MRGAELPWTNSATDWSEAFVHAHTHCVFALIESDPISTINAEDADHSKLFGRV